MALSEENIGRNDQTYEEFRAQVDRDLEYPRIDMLFPQFEGRRIEVFNAAKNREGKVINFPKKPSETK